MPRVARPWFRESRRMWFGLVSGKHVPLSPPTDKTAESEAAALEVFRRLLAQLQPSPGGGATQFVAPRTVREAVADFLERRKPRVGAECHRQYTLTLAGHLCRAFGDRHVHTLTADELESWADRPAWSDTTRHNNLGTVQTFLKWAGHPLPLKRPPKASRGADTVLTDEQFAKVLGAYDSGYGADFAELLRTLRLTGARPQEIARLAVEMVDWPNACVRLKEHKGKRHTAERVIHFCAAAMAILATQKEKHGGAGHLFRTRAGKPYRGQMIKTQMQRLSKRVGFRAIAYGERHGFATRALVSGIPDATVAALLGHTSTAMVSRNYGHVSGQARVLKDAVERVANRAG